jgi:hypothetical protein
MQRARVVLFGGQNPGVPGLDDTWEWDGASWNQIAVTGPFQRAGHVMVGEFASGTVLLASGVPSGIGEAWSLTVDPTGSERYGAGCGSPALDLMSVTQSPRIGQVAGLGITNVPPQSPSFVALGLSNTQVGTLPLPLSLSLFGMSGCWLLQSTDVFALPAAAGAPGTAGLLVPLPNIPLLVGLDLYLQAHCAAPGANAAGVIVSNGVHWRIGA